MNSLRRPILLGIKEEQFAQTNPFRYKRKRGQSPQRHKAEIHKKKTEML
jgi:hypothetical protein